MPAAPPHADSSRTARGRSRPARALPTLVLALLVLAAGALGCRSSEQGTASAPPASVSVDPGTHTLETIAFGSCARQSSEQPIWDSIAGQEPDLYVALGDNIYGDTEDMEVMREKYARLAENPGFRTLRASTPMEAIWDDHDFGENDAGRYYPKRDASEDVFLEFWNVPDTSSRWDHPGIYGSRTYGPEGRRVQLILLDTRYFRDSLRTWPEGERPEGSGPYRPWDDPTTTLLGEAQWNWLARQLEKPARIRILASSIQVVSDRHGWEGWGNFPHERERLFRLIREKEAGGVIVLSGDRHAAEISRYDGPEAGYPLYDVTGSALNQGGGAPNETNPFRTHERKYIEPNFGQIQVGWGQDDPPIRLQIRDVDGDVVREERLHLSTISPY